MNLKNNCRLAAGERHWKYRLAGIHEAAGDVPSAATATDHDRGGGLRDGLLDPVVEVMQPDQAGRCRRIGAARQPVAAFAVGQPELPVAVLGIAACALDLGAEGGRRDAVDSRRIAGNQAEATLGQRGTDHVRRPARGRVDR